MSRFLVYSHADEPLFELNPNDLFEVKRTEEINGEHSLSITATQVLHKEMRLFVKDKTGKWREYVVVGVDALHEQGERAIGTYYLVWSLKHDLEILTIENKRPGVSGAEATAHEALSSLIEGTGSKRWSVGEVTLNTSGGLSMYHESAWEALSDLIDEFGGEVESRIDITSDNSIKRQVCLYEQLGSNDAVRRFDFGSDLKTIKRVVSDDPVYCRIIPLGKGEDKSDGAGESYGRRITIEDVNGGIRWLQNDEAALAFRLPNGMGDFDYPAKYVIEQSIETPQELKAWAESVLNDYTTPKTTYEGSVEQFAEAGMSVEGVELGDKTQCIDKAFSKDAALRVEGRIVKIVVDELNPSDTQLTLGYLDGGFAGYVNNLKSSIYSIQQTVQVMNGGSLTTADYLQRLIDRLNAEINATGGYTYIKPGKGIWVYDKAEDQNPSQCVRIMGGSISIANSKTAQGEWNWQTLMTGKDGLLATAVTAANIITGFIRSSDGQSYWDLDANTLVTHNMQAIGINASGNLSSGNESQRLDIIDGQIRGLVNGAETGVIDFAAHHTSGETVTRGITIRPGALSNPGLISILANGIFVRQSASEAGLACFTGTSSDGYHFVNGLCVSAPV